MSPPHVLLPQSGPLAIGKSGKDMFACNPLVRRIASAALIVSTLLVPNIASAWGSEGHRVTGLIAAELLTPRARIRLNDLIPGADLGDMANYIDLNRDMLSQLIPNSDKWHYDNQPVCLTQTPY